MRQVVSQKHEALVPFPVSQFRFTLVR